jgi:hypothetical protein
MKSSMEKAALMRRLLLVYLVGVVLLAWWPWNGWLVVGAAYGWNRRHKSRARRLAAARLNPGNIDGAQGFHQPVVSGNHLYAPVKDRWIVGRE